MQDNFRNKFRFEKVLVVVFVLGIILTGLIYLLLYAPFTANNKFVIPIRKDFYENVLYKIFAPERLPYIVYVREALVDDSGNMEYVYKLVSKFEKIKTKNRQLMLRDMMGEWWNFDYTTQEYKGVEGEYYRKLMVSEEKIARDNTETNEINYYLYNVDNLDETEPYLRAGDMVAVLWKDKRTLVEIIRDNKSDDVRLIPLSVVASGEKWLIPIYKIVAK